MVVTASSLEESKGDPCSIVGQYEHPCWNEILILIAIQTPKGIDPEAYLLKTWLFLLLTILIIHFT